MTNQIVGTAPYIPAGKKLISQYVDKISLGYFQPVGDFRNMKYQNNTTPDLIDRLCSVSKGAQQVFNKMKYIRDPDTNIAFINKSEMSTSEKKMFTTRVKELRDIGLVLKAVTVDKTHPVKKGSFLINPSMIMLKTPELLNQAKAMWEYLK